MRAIRLTAILIAAAAAAASAARADGGGPGVSGLNQSVLSPDGRSMYVTNVHAPGVTVVKLFRNARVTRSVMLHGRYGVPVVAADGSSEGVSHDGRMLVLAAVKAGKFAVLDARTLRVRQIVRLHGQFSYDALSPDGRTLYLIQHVFKRYANANRYYVRAYDLARDRLLKKIIFDRREKWGLMSGFPVTRVTSATGRWAYTLYSRPGGRPFVHALDTGHRRAVCIDLPWHGSQNAIVRMKLKLRPGKLVVGRYAVIDTRTFRVST